MDTTVLLTGASGRIGRRVVPLLLDRGFRVRALVHSHPIVTGDAEGVELVEGDILDQNAMRKAVEGCSFLLHLAAAWDMFPPAVHERENSQLFESVIRGTFNLLEAARGVPELRAFVYASTDAVYATGMRRFTSPITEDTPLVPSRFYASAKILCESMCTLYGQLYGVPWLVLRICWCLEPAELLHLFTYEFWSDSLSADDRERLSYLSNGKGFFAPRNADGSSGVDHVSHPADIAGGIVSAISGFEDALGRTFNLAGPKPFRYLDVVPPLAERRGLPWESAPVAGIEPYELSTEKARETFGYHPIHSVSKIIAEAVGDPPVA